MHIDVLQAGGRAGSPLPAAVANPRILFYHDGGQGTARPTGAKQASVIADSSIWPKITITERPTATVTNRRHKI
jgi:hypothetical protein